MRVIINSDDLGVSSSVNEQTLDLIGRRQITSATLIANAPALEDAVRKIPKHVACSYGVHLNLTEFTPLTPPEELSSLKPFLDGNGCFAGEAVLRSVPINARARDAFFKEWCLQVKRVLSLGLSVSHFDSHNHVHTMPALFSVLKRVQREFGIRKVRTSWNVYSASSPPSLALLLKKQLWNLALRYYYPTVTTSAFTSFAVFYELAKHQRQSEFIRYDSMELMVHPGHPDFEEETQLLKRDWQRELGIQAQLISYWDL